MNFEFHVEAKKEFNEAIEYYTKIENELGYDFALEIYATIKRTMEFPKAWPLIGKEMRRSLVRRFPYGILYYQEKNTIYILAVMNLHRKPDYWKKRLQS